MDPLFALTSLSSNVEHSPDFVFYVESDFNHAHGWNSKQENVLLSRDKSKRIKMTKFTQPCTYLGLHILSRFSKKLKNVQ